MKINTRYVIGIAALVMGTQAMAQVTFYEGVGFRGRAFTTDKAVRNFERAGFNDRASSVIVEKGRWEVCEDAAFDGKCVMLRPGNYESLTRMGMSKRVSSIRPASRRRDRDDERDDGRDRGRYGDRRGDNDRQAPEPMAQADYDYRRRPQERVFTAPVTSVHAVVGPPNERCWVEREQVSAPRGKMNVGNINVGGAIVGAVLGGVLGHQVGGGTGKSIATAGGAVAGGAIGAMVGRNDNESSTQDVRHCEKVASGPPEFWDVTYAFRGREHKVQMTAPPGPTITVNEDGEPRQ